ncbi:HAD domain-containing protein [Aromatoleum sp.]|uniref:HAD domain-containing protein n=1 Tax=Aromatoleum sp. TaxID=2307007 RepID=UPI002FC6A531
MTQPAYIFMDFDGVTHPWGEVEDFRCLPLIEAVVRDYEEARIVIASDWRVLFSLSKLVSRFSEDLRGRVAGATPHLIPKHGSELHGLREREAMAWLRQHVPDVPSASWCALDDAPGNWFTRSRLLLTDFKRGFTDEDAGALRRMLDDFRSGTPRPAAQPPSFLRRA